MTECLRQSVKPLTSGFVGKSLRQAEKECPLKTIPRDPWEQKFRLSHQKYMQANYKSQERRDLELGCYLLQNRESQWGQLPLAAARGCCLSGSGIMGRIWSSAWLKMDVTCWGYVSFVLFKCMCVCTQGVVNTFVSWMKNAVVSM